MSVIAKLAAASALAAGLLVAPAAHADDDPKRPPQDYGGPPEETTLGDVVVWPPRVVFFPFWVVSEFVFRRPLGALVMLGEKNRWIEEVTDFFTFGERKQFTIFPSALLDFGLKPSVGFNASYRYLGHDKNTAKLHFGTWGPDWVAVKAIDQYDLSDRQSVFVQASLLRRRDNPFSGMGPRSQQDDRVRYASTIGEVAAGQQWAFWRESVFRSGVGLRSLAFQQGGCCDEQSLGEAIATGRLTAPGFGQGYTGPFQRLEIELDSRTPRPTPGSGLRAEAHEEAVFPLDAPAGQARRSWVRYGGSVGGAVDVTGSQRVVSLSVAAELADPLSSGAIPFTDQVSLGGDVLMPGYLRGRLVDRSALVATLQYRWPIWVYLDGVMHAAVGNVWGERFAGFDVKANRLSSGVGIRSNGDRASGFEALFAVGTDPFDEGFNVSSFRLLIGSHHGF